MFMKAALYFKLFFPLGSSETKDYFQCKGADQEFLY